MLYVDSFSAWMKNQEKWTKEIVWKMKQKLSVRISLSDFQLLKLKKIFCLVNQNVALDIKKHKWNTTISLIRD